MNVHPFIEIVVLSMCRGLFLEQWRYFEDRSDLYITTFVRAASE